MLEIRYQAAFRRVYKRIKKRGYDVRLLEEVIEILASGQKPPAAIQGSRAVREIRRKPGMSHHTRLAPDL